MNRTDARTAEKLRNLRDGYGNGIAVYYGSPYIDRTPVLNNVLRDQVWFYYRAACVSDMEQRMRLSKGLRQKGVDLSRNPSYAEIFEKIFSDIPSGEQLIIILDRFEYFFYGEGSFLRSLVNAVETAPSAGRALSTGLLPTGIQPSLKTVVSMTISFTAAETIGLKGHPKKTTTSPCWPIRLRPNISR